MEKNNEFSFLFDNKKSKSFKFNLKDADGKKINIHKYYWLNDKKS